MARQVWPGIYLGGLASFYASGAQPLPFTVAVNVAKEVKYDEDVQALLTRQNIKTLSLPMTDDAVYDLEDADATIDQVHKLVELGEQVLIHCLMGASRSASIVIRYLIRYHQHTYDSALQHLHTFSWVYKPNASFEKQLRLLCL